MPHHYDYDVRVTAPRQQPISLHTSSAFSSSANPDEDWTKISDLAERRRIQNRIAQRNYRKKLKRRLEELEKRASDGTAPMPEKQATTSAKMPKRNQTNMKTPRTAQVLGEMPSQPQPANHQAGQQAHVERLHPSSRVKRERSGTPPFMQYHTYPPDNMQVPSYCHSDSYMAPSESYSNYLTTPIPVSLPPMSHLGGGMKMSHYPNDGVLSSYLDFGFVPGIDISPSPQSHFDHVHPLTPPLSHSFDNSATCSESGYEYPTTPLSMPASPAMMQ